MSWRAIIQYGVCRIVIHDVVEAPAESSRLIIHPPTWVVDVKVSLDDEVV